MDENKKTLEGFRRLEKAATPQERAEYQSYIDHLEEETLLWTPIPRAIEDESFALEQPKAEATRLLYIRARWLAQHLDHARAAVSARKMLDLDSADPENLYRAAGCYALCASAVSTERTPKENPAGRTMTLDEYEARAVERIVSRDEYEARAVDLLAKAIKHGYARALDARTDEVLSSIRDQPDIQKLLRELEERTGKGGAAR